MELRLFLAERTSKVRERDVLVGFWKQQEENTGAWSEHSPGLIVVGEN